MAEQESKMSRLLDEFKPKCYESEFTQFLREFKQQHPETETEQSRSRSLWWDHPQDLDTQQRHRESRIKQQAYVYQNKV